MEEAMQQDVQKDPGAEQHALRSVERHHAVMLEKLRKLVSSLIQAVEGDGGDAEHSARNALVEWCDSELIPHAVAEEGPLYGGPKKTEEGRLLVEGMLAEHQVIIGLVERLRTAQGVKAAVAGGSIEEIFALHLDKENRLLMPFIADSRGLSLAEAVHGLHELTGEAHPHGDHDERS
jgi:iron-sulfur cluster repair protein YtfE (RIC family)